MPRKYPDDEEYSDLREDHARNRTHFLVNGPFSSLRHDEWTTYVTFLIGPDKVPFPIHFHVAIIACPRLDEYLDEDMTVTLPDIEPEYFNWYAIYIYAGQELRYEHLYCHPTDRDKWSCEIAWNNVAQLAVIAEALGNKGMVHEAFEAEGAEEEWSQSLPDLKTIELAYSPSDDPEGQALAYMRAMVLEAWARRATLDDFIPVEDELSEQFKRRLLVEKLSMRDTAMERGAQ